MKVPEYVKTKVTGWPGYPQILYQNWLPDQVKCAQIRQAIDEPWVEPCTIRMVTVDVDGNFEKHEPQVWDGDVSRDELWAALQVHVGFRFRLIERSS